MDTGVVTAAEEENRTYAHGNKRCTGKAGDQHAKVVDVLLEDRNKEVGNGFWREIYGAFG